jgi:GrpB-like predicted nucleotidyltransferase (UPF0157 family)
MRGVKQKARSVEVVDYDPSWPEVFSAERETLLALAGSQLVALEHVGSTAIPGLRAKPIIDIMASVESLEALDSILPALERLGYQLTDAGMPNRFFLRKAEATGERAFHLHIVEVSSWSGRKERLMRDYLLDHPEVAAAYAALKTQLAITHAKDSLAYTRAKTDFVQGVVDRARDRLGLPRVNVWEGQ